MTHRLIGAGDHFFNQQPAPISRSMSRALIFFHTDGQLLRKKKKRKMNVGRLWIKREIPPVMLAVRETRIIQPAGGDLSSLMMAS